MSSCGLARCVISSRVLTELAHDASLHTLPAANTRRSSASASAAPRVQDVRRLFVEPEVQQPADMPALAWKAPDEDALVAWLCHEKQFSEERVRSAIAKMAAAKGKANQNRMESFFKARPCPCPCTARALRGLGGVPCCTRHVRAVHVVT